MNKKQSNLLVVIGACLTLGLAPFFPEPHIVGKIRWVAGGGKGMQLMDVFDLLLHGIPWLAFLVLGVVYLFGKKDK